jgi:ribosomal protein L40E
MQPKASSPHSTPRSDKTHDHTRYCHETGRVTALLIGTLLAVASLCFVLFPLFRQELPGAPRKGRDIKPRQILAVDALRELEFDRETGKISDSDYEPLKARYTAQALAVMRAGNAAVCEKCGPRPEQGAQFCSKCGSPLIS